MPTRLIARHDTADLPRFRALDTDGTPLSLAGATVTYTLRERAGTAYLVLHGAATVANQETNPGEAYYRWGDGETGTDSAALVALAYGAYKDYVEEWEVHFADGTIETFPKRPQDRVIVRILADLDNT